MIPVPASIDSPRPDPGWKNRRDWLLCLVIAAACVALYLLPTGFEQENKTDSEAVRALVLSTTNDQVGQYGIIRQGEQQLRVRLLAGKAAGKEVDAENLLRGDAEFDFFFRPGDTALVVVNYDDKGNPSWVHPSGPYRLGAELWLGAAFALLLLFALGWTGFKAILSFLFCALLIWKGLLPLFLAGVNPYLAGLAATALFMAAIMFLVGGVNRRGLASFLGSLCGVLISFLIAYFFAHWFEANGMTRPFAKVLAQRFPELDLRAVFQTGIFLCASGAVMDLAMDIAAALEELAQRNPGLSRWELARSGMRIGRAVIGTMTTTLLLAYSGGYTACMMWFMAQNIPLEIMLNTSFISAEILNTLAGSFGLVAVAPLTALIAAYFFHHADVTIKSNEQHESGSIL